MTSALMLASAGMALGSSNRSYSGSPTAVPSSLDFGQQKIGTTGSSQSVVVTVRCAGLDGTNMLTCSPPQTVYPMSIHASGDFIANAPNCPPVLVANNPYLYSSCVINVSFRPQRTGLRTGTLTTGSNPGSPTVSLSGTGVPTTSKKCKSKLSTILGTTGADQIAGTPGRDVINALGGNDKVSGLGGKDLICGGSGKDKLKGGPGKDTLLGQGGNDILKGGGANDKCKGGKGKDTLVSC
jgi:Ca2+-binding RTX toxin-like protein